MSSDKVASYPPSGRSCRGKTLSYRLALHQRNFHVLDSKVESQTFQLDLKNLLLPRDIVELTLKKETLESKKKLLGKFANHSCQLIFRNCKDYKVLLAPRLKKEMLLVSHQIGLFFDTAHRFGGDRYCESFFKYFVNELNALVTKTVTMMNTKHCSLLNGRFIFDFWSGSLSLTFDKIQNILSARMRSSMRRGSRRDLEVLLA